jgi:hypothetical protein
MSDKSSSGLSIDDWFNDSDYNPNSPIQVSEFESTIYYENLMINRPSISTDCNNSNVNMEYNDNIQVIEDSDEEQSDSEVRKSKKKNSTNK